MIARWARGGVTAMIAVSVCCVAAPIAHAQGGRGEIEWHDLRTRQLVERAVALRSSQFAGNALRDYTARAQGYLTFLAQVGEGFPEPPRVVKVDQLAVEVLWKPPMLSKQRLIGQRDTLLLPGVRPRRTPVRRRG